MPALMEGGHQGRALRRRIEGGLEDAFLGPRTAFFGTAVEPTDGRKGRLLPSELDQRVVLARDMNHGERRRRLPIPAEASGDGADSGKNVRSRLPEQVAERRAVGMTHGVDAAVVDRVLLLEVSQDGVEELHVPAALAVDGGLPAGHAPFFVDQRRDRRQALRKDQDRSGVDVGVTPGSGGVRGAAAMAVPAEDHGQLTADSGGHAHEGGPLHTIDRPGLLHEPIRRPARKKLADLALGGQRSRAEDGEQDEEETSHK